MFQVTITTNQSIHSSIYCHFDKIEDALEFANVFSRSTDFYDVTIHEFEVGRGYRKEIFHLPVEENE